MGKEGGAIKRKGCDFGRMGGASSKGEAMQMKGEGSLYSSGWGFVDDECIHSKWAGLCR